MALCDDFNTGQAISETMSLISEFNIYQGNNNTPNISLVTAIGQKVDEILTTFGCDSLFQATSVSKQRNLLFFDF